jgi:hypothetical protein
MLRLVLYVQHRNEGLTGDDEVQDYGKYVSQVSEREPGAGPAIGSVRIPDADLNMRYYGCDEPTRKDAHP